MFPLRFPAGVPTALALWAGARSFNLLPGWGWLLVGGSGLVFCILARRRPRSHAVLLAVILTAGAAAALRQPRHPPPSLPSGEHRVAGRVEAWETSPERVTATVRVHRVDTLRVRSPAAVRVLAPASWGPEPEARWIRFSGKVLPERGVTNPGGWASGRFVATILAERKGMPAWGPGRTPRLIRARAALVGFIRERVPGFSGRLAEAVLLGRSRALTEGERNQLRRSGASHLVAVSGLHVGLAALLAGLLLGPAPAPVRYLGTALTAWSYAALAGWSPSAVRAAALVGGWSLGSLFHRGRPPHAWLALALPWLLWFDADLADSVGFVLSVSAVGGILFVVDALGTGGGSPLRRLAAPVAASLGAQWGTLPVAVAAFGQVAPLALVPNLIAVPLVGLFLPALLFAFVFSPVPFVSEGFLQSVTGLGSALETVLAWCGRHLPFVTGIPPSPVWVRLSIPVLVVIWFSAGEEQRRRTRVRAPALILAAGLAVACFLPPAPPPGPWVAFLDVGQGDGAVLRMRDGTVWVVDVGDDRSGDQARFVLLPFLRWLGVRRVDGLVLSHRHRDHVGSLARFLEGIPVDRVYDAGFGSSAGGTPARVDRLLSRHRRWPCLVARGDTLHAGEADTLVALFPERANPEEADPESLNDASLVLRYTGTGFSILFPGDAESKAERGLLRGSGDLTSRILKVGHHGSRTSSSPAFLDAVDPEWAVISCGEENRFGHPSPEVVDRLGCRGIRVARTDRDGAVWIRPSGEGLAVRTHPPRGRGWIRARLLPGSEKL